MDNLKTKTLAPHLYSQLLNELRDTAVKYQGAQQLRAQLGRTLSKYLQPDHKFTSGGFAPKE